MISFEEALERMLASTRPLASELIPFEQCNGRVLAEDVRSDMDMPPFDKSAMDGFACRRQDLPGPFRIIEEIPAGRMPVRTIGAGEASRIMTGAPLPPGADCVFMLEDSVADVDERVSFTGQSTSDNYCRRAEDLHVGDVVLKKGELLGPAHLAVLATVGQAEVRVSCRPHIAVIATGSELVDARKKPEGAAIRNSNSPQLMAQAVNAGAAPRYYGIVPDSIEATREAIVRARQENDVLLLSGGVSCGDFDYVPRALLDVGYKFLFESVAMQPGRPTVFGSDGNTWCLGLPGNPVSTYIIFEMMLKPFLYRLMGHAFQPRIFKARLAEGISRKKAARQSSVPVRLLADGSVASIEYHGSAHIGTMAGADGLVTLPVGCLELKQGDSVDVRPL